MRRALTAVVTLKDVSTSGQVGDRKASGRIPHNLETLANLGHSTAGNRIYFLIYYTISINTFRIKEKTYNKKHWSFNYYRYIWLILEFDLSVFYFILWMKNGIWESWYIDEDLSREERRIKWRIKEKVKRRWVEFSRSRFWIKREKWRWKTRRTIENGVLK